MFLFTNVVIAQSINKRRNHIWCVLFDFVDYGIYERMNKIKNE